MARLSDDGVVEAATCFPGENKLLYILQLVGTGDTTTATFENSVLRVAIPRAIGSAWAQSDEISLQAEVSIPEGKLSVLVEKDFACLTPREGEDESDLYPHPQQGQTTC